jgi:serine protease Do
MNRFFLVIVAVGGTLFSTASISQAQDSNSRRSPEMLRAFRDVVSQAAKSTVRVLGDGAEVALATIVDSDGYLVTKYSELKGKLTCRLPNGRTINATLIGVEPRFDLAMLKVDVTGLTPVTWTSSTKVEVGDWVATPAPGKGDALAVGVVGVATRKPKLRDYPTTPAPSNSGFMGVRLKDGEGPAIIAAVEPKGPAEKAGMKANDVVLEIGGNVILNADGLMQTVQKYKPGDKVKVVVQRPGPNATKEELTVELGKRPAMPGGIDRGDFQNRMGSTLSVKRSGFPTIFQHDMVVKPTDCGGPVVNLDGQVVGINIARGGRTESYAIPAEVVQSLLVELRSGKLAPPKPPEPPKVTLSEEARKRLDSLEKDLKEVENEIASLQKKIDGITGRDEASREKRDNMRRQIAEFNRTAEALQREIDNARMGK